MFANIDSLYQEPYVSEVQKIDCNQLSLQQFSLQLKSIVLAQQNNIHKVQYQTLKEMKLSCLQLKQQFQLLKQHVELYNNTAAIQEVAESNNQDIQKLKVEISKLQQQPEYIYNLINFTLMLNKHDINNQQQTTSPARSNHNSTDKNELQNSQTFSQSQIGNVCEYSDEQQFKYQFLLKQQFSKIQLDAHVEQILQQFQSSSYAIQESMLMHFYVIDMLFSSYQGTLNLGGYLYNYVQQVTIKLIPILFSQLKKQSNKRLLATLQIFNPMKYKQIVLQTVASTSQNVSQQLSQAGNIYELVYNFYSTYQYYREQFLETFPHKNEIDVMFSTILSQEFKPKFNIMLTRLTFNESKENVFSNQISEYIDNYQKIQCILEFFRLIEHKQLNSNQNVQQPPNPTLDVFVEDNQVDKNQLSSDTLICVFDNYLNNKVPDKFKDIFSNLRPQLQNKFKQLDTVSQEEDLIQDMISSVTKQLSQKLFECSETDYFYNVQIVSQLLSYHEKGVDNPIYLLQQEYFDYLCNYTQQIMFTDNTPLANDKMQNVLAIYECATQYHNESKFKDEVKQMLVRYFTHVSTLLIKNKHSIQNFQKEFNLLKQNNVTWEEASTIFNTMAEQVNKQDTTTNNDIETQQK